MAVQHIPTSNEPYYLQRTDLEGKGYILLFDYSSREDCWYLSLQDIEGVPLASGIKLVCNWPLTYRLPNPGLPPGKFLITTKTEGNDSPPGLNDLAEDGRCELTYVTSNHVFTEV